MKTFADIERDFVREKVLPDFDWERFDAPSPVNPLRAPLKESTVAIVTTAGAYINGEQSPFKSGKAGDSSYREFPGNISIDQIELSHVGYDTKRASFDPNVVFPLDRLRELAAVGKVAGVAPRHYSFMGYSPNVGLLKANADDVAQRFVSDEVNLVLLVPA